MDDLTIFSVEFRDDLGQQTLVIDDDGRVAYAYLIGAGGEICSDVWLYNRCDAPAAPEWTSPEKMPFANPINFVKNEFALLLPTNPDQFSVEWVIRGGKSFARIFLRGELVAELTDGARPGWSSLAKKNGPLARILETA